ncbi:MAG: phosphoribosylaminoimidazolesuccinocarboxamide synthase [Dehalococcoidia bacterium]|nr:phosphoribosylaminoimidazolesuccinocarboxamide synthase [Dehalococcoidia bacterium]
MELLLETDLPNLFYRGKVRDTYDLGDSLLIIATDRISAFDSVLPCGIPDKGVVLNQLSAFWFEKTAHLVPNHLIAVVDDAQWLNNTYGEKVCSGYYSFPDYVARRSMVVKKAERIDIECVARGYISGAAWAEYQEKGTVNGVSFPKGLVESEKLTEPIFTPTTKADSGHDEPITIDEMKRLLGEERAEELTEKTMRIYRYAHDYAMERGIIIADTKVEFGLVNDRVLLIDELLTPDSSRFWDASLYQAGRSQSSFDKQPVRDWLVQAGWDKEPPAPMLPEDVIAQTTDRYREAYHRLTGKEL